MEYPNEYYYRETAAEVLPILKEFHQAALQLHYWGDTERKMGDTNDNQSIIDTSYCDN